MPMAQASRRASSASFGGTTIADSRVRAGGGGGRGFASGPATFYSSRRMVAAPAPASPVAEEGAPGASYDEAAAKGMSNAVHGSFFAKKSEASSSLARQIAMAPSNGAVAVAREKALNKMKTKDFVQDEESKSSGIKWIEGKTFYLKDGFWTDSALLEGSHPQPEVIQFGSTKYFELVKKHPGITKFLGAGAKVMVLFEGRCLKIVTP